MDDTSESVMIALLPITTDWCKIELAHMTLVYAGKVTDMKPASFNELSKDAASIAMLANPITLQVTGSEVFGDVDKVDVFRLRPSSELMAMRRAVENWNASEFPFSPHVTIGPTSPLGPYLGPIPRLLAFDRLMVAYGNENLTFWLKTNNF